LNLKQTINKHKPTIPVKSQMLPTPASDIVMLRAH
jgi:hypothetical protein